MTDKDRELQIDSADLLMERGVQFKLPALSFWDRIRGRNTVVIRPPLVSTALEICKISTKYELDIYISDMLIVPLPEQLSAIAHVVAVAICRDRRTIEKRADKLARHIERHVEMHSLMSLFQTVVSMLGTESFRKGTVSLVRMNQMMMTRRGTEKGS